MPLAGREAGFAAVGVARVPELNPRSVARPRRKSAQPEHSESGRSTFELLGSHNGRNRFSPVHAMEELGAIVFLTRQVLSDLANALHFKSNFLGTLPAPALRGCEE